MNQFSDYYRILGVMRDAEQVVITAAYRALASMYHPDRWKGDVGVATSKMAEINVAYGVLGDPAKRRAYDQENQTTTNSMGPDADTVDEAFDAALVEFESRWGVAVEVLPDLAVIRKRLSKIAHRLAFEFVVLMVETKKFDQRESIANDMEKMFLVAHFGSQPDIINFAKTLIELGQREAIRALNNYVDVLGTGLDPQLIIKKINSQFDLETIKKKYETAKKIDTLKRDMATNRNIWSAMQLAKNSGFEVLERGVGFFSFSVKYNIYQKNALGLLNDRAILEQLTEEQVIEWVLENLC